MNNPATTAGKSHLIVFLDTDASLELRSHSFSFANTQPRKSPGHAEKICNRHLFACRRHPLSQGQTCRQLGRARECGRVLYDIRGRAFMHEQKAGGKLR
jgi:hypothetical protein